MSKKKVVYLDMDGVLVDFHSHPTMEVPRDAYNHPNIYKKGYFKNLKPIPGALHAVQTILDEMPEVDLHILTKGLSESPDCYKEKMEWILNHLPVLHDKVIITCDKTLAIGDVLVDDSLTWKGFPGRLIHFDPEALGLGAADLTAQTYISMWQETLEMIEAVLCEHLH